MKNLVTLFAIVFLSQFASAQNWEEQADVPVDLSFPVVVQLNGFIHVMGGGTGQGATSYHARFDPVNNIWETMADVPYEAQQPAGAVVNGKIHYCGGGFPNSGTPLNDHYYYDPTLDEWFEAEDLPTARVIHEAVGLNGKLYVMSGQPDKDRFDVYDPTDDSWTQLNDLPDDNFWYGAIVATANTIYRFGGGGYLSPQELAHEYDVENDTWIEIPDLPVELHAPAGVAVNDMLICINGGYVISSQEETYLYNTVTQEYMVSDVLPVPRCYHSLAIANSCVFSVGGYYLNDETLGTEVLKNCEIVATDIEHSLPDIQKPYRWIAGNSSFQVQLHNMVANEKNYFRIVDMSGRVLLDDMIPTTDDNFQFSNTHFSPGKYLVILLIGDQSFTENWMITE